MERRFQTEIIASRGYAFEEHYVTTQDGFILGLQRIPRGRSEESKNGGKQVVFLQHGFLADASTWVMDSATESLGYILADSGFDVWLGNIRGNDYSRRHVKYLPNQHIFWNWSWQEMAHFDLPAMINYVLHVTGQKQLFYVGHSQGTLIAFNGFADNPDLGKKIKAFFALAPVYTLNNVTKIAQDVAAILYPLVKKLDPNLTFDLLPGDVFRALIELGFCAYPIEENICYDLVQLVVGMDSKDIDESRVPVYIAHLFEGTSFKDFFHYAQMIFHRNCQKFDYGSTGNKRHYNQTTAPLCNVQGMPTPTMMFVATEDKLGDPADNAALKPQIKNLVHYEMIQGWNHLDFLYGKDAHVVLYPKLVAMMKTRFN
ncbi:Lysosomal acid lipase/cholesteryl ester hydrolase [Acropora cervicornis]|uniref:Lipase n=1 Tax=Acropora cervicornis TaxID=6130 RepID=A0AAD9R3Y8_ACRCE|nr:Lysosomal acid lipase/cholesteryl ester hydrolase [Acropora cervicornis]